MTTPKLSAAWVLDTAIAAAIEAEHARTGAALGALLNTPPVYSGEARAGDGSPVVLAPAYVVLGGSSEGDAPGSAFRRRRRENTLTLDIWTADTSKRTAMLIYAEVARVLNGQAVALEGYGSVRLALELVVSMMDPGRAAYHAQCRVHVLSFPPAAP